MKTSPAFIWTLSIVAFLALLIGVADRVGWIDRVVNSKAPVAKVETQASQGDDMIEGMIAKLESSLPRFFPETTDIGAALNNYARETDPARRVFLAYDLISLKFRNDLRKQAPLSPEQMKIYENAEAYIKWTQGLISFYLNAMPEDKIGDVTIALGENHQVLKADMAKRILIATLNPSGQCSDEDFTALGETFTAENLAMQGSGLLPVFLTIQAQMTTQLLTFFEQRLLDSPQATTHRDVLKAIFDVREKTLGPDAAKSERSEKDKKRLQEFFDNKGRDAGFTAYAVAPGCFQPTGMSSYLKHLKRLESEVKAAYFLEMVRADYTKTRKIPQDLEAFRNDSPISARDQFYSRPRDGWYSTFVLKVEGNHAQLISPGADRKEGTEDDFVAAEGDLDKRL